MPDHGQVVLIRIGLDVLNFPNNAVDIRHAGAPAAGGAWLRRIGGQIMLQPDHQIATSSKKVFL